MKINFQALSDIKALTLFANANVEAGNTKAVAVLNKVGGGRAEVIRNTSDKPFAFTRSRENKDLNNEVRTLFREAIAKAFGGEDKIPQNVKKAMVLGDYGKGRPLTARRIYAVEKAIIAAIEKNPFLGSTDEAFIAMQLDSSQHEDIRIKIGDDIDSPRATGGIKEEGNSINSDDDEASEINTSEKKPEQPVSPEQTEYNTLKSKGFEKLSMAEKKRYFELEGKLNSKGFTTYLGVGGVRPGARKNADIVQDNFDPTDKDKEVKKLDEVKVVTGKKKRNIKPFTFEG